MLQAYRVLRHLRPSPTGLHARPTVASSSRVRTPGVAPSSRQLWTGQENPRGPLVLFDIANDRSPCSLQSARSAPSHQLQQSFSPNTIRSRLALHYKGLPYTQSWISYPDIERLWDKLGIPPNDTQDKAGPRCTLPVLLVRTEDFPQASLSRLHDANIPGVPKKGLATKFGMFTPFSSTLSIALALELLFHDRNLHPPLFPTHQSYEQAQQVEGIITRLLPATRRLILPSVPDILDARGKEYFIRTRKQWFGVSSLDELRPQSQRETDKLWEEIEHLLQPIIRTLQESPPQRGPALNDPFTWKDDGDDQTLGNNARNQGDEQWETGVGNSVRYLSGASSLTPTPTPTPTYADFILMAYLAWIARVDMDVWARLTQDVGGGVLENLWTGCLPYMKSHTYVRTLSWFR
ncbi:hypothetical protein PV04_03473 [Phialophora macrospora]|uniref:Uncharacterized protein n=1 Tax=Phialophora macrospora TaxID=1851006 RepID=A0A0D2FXV5_9EURO|nr:hypothetical protein PV04_03473 [Phialophora macrospora]